MRRFRHKDQEWEAQSTGAESGVSAGPDPPPFSSRGVVFRCLSDPKIGPYFGSIAERDVRDASDESLRQALDAAIARATGKDA